MDERERNQYDYERRNYENRPGQDPKKRRIWGGVLAALLVLGGIWGWNAARDNRENVSMERQVQQRTSAVRGGYDNRIATTSGQARVIKVDKNAIEKLKQGESVDFYLSEIKRQGYTVTPIHKMKDHSTFVVHNQIQEGTKRREALDGVLVTLHRDDKSKPDKVTSIETEDYKP